MNCISCGAIIPDGATNCPNCGQPAPNMGFAQPQMQQPQMQQPQMSQPQMSQPQMGQPQMGQPQMQQPMGGYQQPMGGYQQPMGGYQQPMGGYQQPMGGYAMAGGAGFNSNKFVMDLKTNYMKVISMVGALLIFISPFFHWLAAKYDGDKEACNMFSLAGDKKGIDEGIFAFYAIMFLLIGATLICLELADYIPALYNIKAKIPSVQIVELVLVALALLFWFLAFFNGDLSDVVKAGKKYLKWLDEDGYVRRGLGPIVAMLGVIASAFPRACKMATGKQY